MNQVFDRLIKSQFILMRANKIFHNICHHIPQLTYPKNSRLDDLFLNILL